MEKPGFELTPIWDAGTTDMWLYLLCHTYQHITVMLKVLNAMCAAATKICEEFGEVFHNLDRISFQYIHPLTQMKGGQIIQRC